MERFQQIMRGMAIVYYRTTKPSSQTTPLRNTSQECKRAMLEGMEKIDPAQMSLYVCLGQKKR